MSTQVTRRITLESLSEGIPAIPQAAAAFFQQNCMVCFHRVGHGSGVTLTVDYSNANHTLEIHWTEEVDGQLLRSFEERRATDNAACAIALLLLRELTDFTAIEQAAIGTTIDYYLVSKQRAGELRNEDLIFNYAEARLEVSGILRENEGNTVEQRIRQKLRRLRFEGDLPDLVIVVEFSRPWAKMVAV